MRRVIAMLAFGAAVALLLAVPGAATAAGDQASGTLVDGAGNQIGGVQLVQTASGVVVTVTLTGSNVVAPGAHGIHFHAVGKCNGPDFATAGAHFNPTGRQHGIANPNGPHAGDLPNLTVGPGTASAGGYTYRATTTGITLSPGGVSIFDDDGTALVIHANPDDDRTDPAGNSGGRIACAVIVPSSGVAALSVPGTSYFIRRLGEG